MACLVIIDGAIKIGLQTLGLGMGIVIGMLLLLQIILQILIPLFSSISKKTVKKEEKVAEVPSAPAVAAPQVQQEDDCGTVAAIIAAIAAYEGKSPEGFRVVSFKRI